jgi:hypothetical protein
VLARQGVLSYRFVRVLVYQENPDGQAWKAQEAQEAVMQLENKTLG